ncbi:hypothetical protein PR048_016022 [Dryococelus australis]|uniref:Uncharacterized protein n=1 Tax=Dryococelus australis TaxID=614101 RepID=A0ABQ9HIR3_9NEOP|nr:hypothetical protein PR048_016022 [Dryococelus australis]
MLRFRECCRQSIQKFITKLVVRFSLAYKLTTAVSYFDPSVAANIELGSKRLTVLLTLLADSKWLNSSMADKAAREYMCTCSQPKVQDSLKKFSRKSLQCADTENIAHVMKLVMILSHGNANLEREFSIYSESLLPNMKKESLVARRYVYDSVSTIGGVEKFKLRGNEKGRCYQEKKITVVDCRATIEEK